MIFHKKPNQFIHLFEPIKIGQLEIKNRIVFLAVGSRLFEKAGRVTDRWADFFIARAKGGAGLVTAPASPIMAGETNSIIGLYDEQSLHKLQSIIDEIHYWQSKAAVQLTAKNQWQKEPNGCVDSVAPSSVAKRKNASLPRELHTAEICMLVESFGDAALRAKICGFDLIEIHAGMGYLVNQFLSPVTNQRTDDYGGSLENRLRFLLEIIANIKKKVGADFPLMVRLSADEFMPGGNTVEESAKMAIRLEQAGVHGLNIQGGWHESNIPLSHNVVAPGAFAYLAEAIKRVVSVPVVAAYRINNPHVAEAIIASGKTDLVGMARALLADPELPNKAKANRLDEIAPCIACMRCLESILVYNGPITCTVNPFLGRESESSHEPVTVPKKVFIAGSGPAGLEAAWAAASSGHCVTVWEKDVTSGGSLKVASVPPHKEELGLLQKYLFNRATKAGAIFRMGEILTQETVTLESPDVLIVATGASPLIPSIPGINRSNVMTAVEVLSGIKEAGKTVAIVGAGLVGCETSLFLAQLGITVILVEQGNTVAEQVSPSNRWVLLKQLREAGIAIKTKTQVTMVHQDGIEVLSDASPSFIAVDSVVLALGMTSNQEIHPIKPAGVRTIVIGDASKPRLIYDAIREGLQAVESI